MEQIQYLELWQVDNTPEAYMGSSYRYMEWEGKPYTGMVYEMDEAFGYKYMEANVRKGHFHGWVTHFWPNGKVSKLQEFRFGNTFGKSYHWDEAGNITMEGYSEYSVLTSFKRWDSEGNLLETFNMPPDYPGYQDVLDKRKEMEGLERQAAAADEEEVD